MMRDGHDGGAEAMTFGQRFHHFVHPLPKLGPPTLPALLEHERERAERRQNRVADAITAFSGSMLFVYIHIIWFSCWIGFGVESYPYGLLTMIVSLEAIFLSTFVMISQNRADAKRQVIADSQWKMVGLILLRFNYTSVHAISLLFGFVAIAAGVMECVMVFVVPGWWKVLNGLLAVLFLVAGVVAFVHPGNTFVALAAVFSFFLLFAGTFDIIQSIAARNEISVWWLQLIGGIIEIALAFWAAGDYGRS